MVGSQQQSELCRASYLLCRQPAPIHQHQVGGVFTCQRCPQIAERPSGQVGHPREARHAGVLEPMRHDDEPDSSTARKLLCGDAATRAAQFRGHRGTVGPHLLTGQPASLTLSCAVCRRRHGVAGPRAAVPPQLRAPPSRHPSLPSSASGTSRWSRRRCARAAAAAGARSGPPLAAGGMQGATLLTGERSSSVHLVAFQPGSFPVMQGAALLPSELCEFVAL